MLTLSAGAAAEYGTYAQLSQKGSTSNLAKLVATCVAQCKLDERGGNALAFKQPT